MVCAAKSLNKPLTLGMKIRKKKNIFTSSGEISLLPLRPRGTLTNITSP